MPPPRSRRTTAPGSGTTPVVAKLIAPGPFLHALITAAAPSAANQARLARFWLLEPMTIDRVLYRVVAQAGNLDVGLYRLDGAGGKPKTRIVSTGSFACPAVGGVATAIAGQALVPGHYAVALATDNAGFSSHYATDGDQLPNALGTMCWFAAASFPLPADVEAAVVAQANVIGLEAGQA